MLFVLVILSLFSFVVIFQLVSITGCMVAAALLFIINDLTLVSEVVPVVKSLY